MFDPDQLPVPDLGLRCRGCGYPLGALTEHRCPECGRAFALPDYVPDGLMPPLFAGGQPVRATPRIVALLERYHLAYQELRSPLEDLGHPGLTTYDHRPIGVAREDYLFAIDLIRREHRGEAMPPVPEPMSAQPWVCSGCDAECPGNFAVCWRCQRPRGVPN